MEYCKTCGHAMEPQPIIKIEPYDLICDLCGRKFHCDYPDYDAIDKGDLKQCDECSLRYCEDCTTNGLCPSCEPENREIPIKEVNHK